MDDRLKTDYVKLDVLETLRASPAVLLGVDVPAATALEAVAIGSASIQKIPTTVSAPRQRTS
jgi:hypothetical protein